MAQRHPDPTIVPAAGTGTDPTGPGTGTGTGTSPRPPAPGGPTAGAVLAPHLRERATRFLRTLRDLRDGEPHAVPALRENAHVTAAVLHTYGPLLDPDWATGLRAELSWLAAGLGREHTYEARLDRLQAALHHLSRADGDGPAPGGRSASDPGPAASRVPASRAPDALLPVGTARAAALLHRQLTLARTRAHSATLETLRSERFHALADAMAVLVGEVPLAHPGEQLAPLCAAAATRVRTAADALTAEAPDAPGAPGSPDHRPADPYDETHDADWERLRRLLCLHRHAEDVLTAGQGPTEDPTPADDTLARAARALAEHRDAIGAAQAAAAAARTPRIAPATAYALGVLHADQRHEAAAAREAFHRARPWAATPAPVA
ncbi:CHAD domain-containing protein [Streptomyces sp. NPDC060194]|uniref:CHAD domain-containing protein n=1 Tax=Streptomyces sp. NPDC060194 TaxID=3347069 RepID=UPI00364AC830